MSQLLIIVFVGIVAIGAGLGYWVRRRDVGKKAAARDARRGIAIIGIVTLVGFGASRLFSGFGADVSGSVLFSLLLAASCLVFVAWFSWRKRQAGRVLVDLGRSTNHKMFVVLGFLFPGLNVIPLLVPLIFDFFKKSLVIWGHRGLERCAVRTASPSRGSRRLFSST